MSTTTNRETAPRDGGSVDHRLARLLDTPFLARVVPHLAPETLHQLIQYRGLDACGEIVTSATPAQLTFLLDLDLWRHAQPGRDEQFDVDRFGEWLEVLVDTGDSVAARTVAALDKHLVIVGLSRYLRIFDPGTFEPTESSDDESKDRNEMMNSETSGDVLECEVGGYLVRARRTDAWNAIVTLLVTLETEQNDYFHAVMQGCRRLSNSRPEIDGLDLLRQRGRLRQRRDRVDVHAAGHHDRGRARRTRDLPRRRHRRGELPPALRPQRPERRIPPGVPIFVQRAEWGSVHEPNYTVAEWIDVPGISYEILDGESEVAPGLRVTPTPGHTAGHQSLVLDAPDGTVVLAGQAVQSRAEWEGSSERSESGASSARDPRYPGSVDRLRSLAPVRVHFAHDPAVWER